MKNCNTLFQNTEVISIAVFCSNFIRKKIIPTFVKYSIIFTNISEVREFLFSFNSTSTSPNLYACISVSRAQDSTSRIYNCHCNGAAIPLPYSALSIQRSYKPSSGVSNGFFKNSLLLEGRRSYIILYIFVHKFLMNFRFVENVTSNFPWLCITIKCQQMSLATRRSKICKIWCFQHLTLVELSKTIAFMYRLAVYNA